MRPLILHAVRLAFVAAVLLGGEAAYAQSCEEDTDCPPRQCFRANCLGNGTCQYVALNNVACNDGNQCTTADTCRQGVCVGTPATGTVCNDANACTQTDTCQAGTCVGTNPVTCTALDQCHVPGTCDPQTGVCSNPPIADDTPCTDGDACTQTDTCQAGVCEGDNPVTCTALDQCHVAGTCDPQTGVCSNPNAENGVPCTDQNACTQNDTCQTGICEPGPPIVCSPQDQCHLAGVCDPQTGVCSNPTVPDNSPCSDQNACTLADTCQGGTCQSGAPVTCSTQDQCQVAGTCNPETGLCSTSNAPDGTLCSDLQGCTEDDACQNGVCVPGPLKVCPAEGQCQVGGVCNLTNGQCPPTTPAPDNTPCNDANACTQTDTCQSGVCTGNNPVTCGSDGGCTSGGECNPETGQCSGGDPVADGTYCNDQNPCTTGEVCKYGVCVGKPAMNGVYCDDLNPCTSGDTCAYGTCTGKQAECPPPVSTCLSAGICTATGGCTYVPLPAGTPCSDGDVCTVGDICDEGGVCRVPDLPPGLASATSASTSTPASRSLGFFMVHERAVEACLRDGSVRLGSVRISSVSEALGLLWASPMSMRRGDERTLRDREWLQLARQTLVAVCNQRVFGAKTVDPKLIDDSVRALKGNACTTMKTLAGRLEVFNEVGAARALPSTFDAGPATPSRARSIAKDPTRATNDTCSTGEQP